MDNEDHNCGLALLWNEGADVAAKSFSRNHINMEVCLNDGDEKWRFTGFYGISKRSKRQESRNLLKRLSSHKPLPWVVKGDFNDILNPEEKHIGNSPTEKTYWWLQRCSRSKRFKGLRASMAINILGSVRGGLQIRLKPNSTKFLYLTLGMNFLDKQELLLSLQQWATISHFIFKLLVWAIINLTPNFTLKICG